MKSSLKNLKRVQPLLGTFVEIELQGTIPEAKLNARISAGFAAISEIEQLMSYHQPTSDLSRVNKSNPGTWVQVHPFTLDVFKLSNQLFLLSDGVFDIRCGATLAKWKFLPPAFKSAHRPRRAEHRALPMEINKGRVRKTGPWTLDLGGIAKGFAVDQAVKIMQRDKKVSGIVNAGGDMRVFGKKLWPISLRHPKKINWSIPFLKMKTGAMATSGIYFSKKRIKHEWVSPLVDTKKSRPFLKGYSITVLSESCCVADALTKIVTLKANESDEILEKFQSKAYLTTMAGIIRSLN